MNTLEDIKNQISSNSVLLYMKGSPQFPQCGFSARVVKILNSFNTKYAFVNILERQDIRSELPKYANWPTFPQLYINGELIGGCDIVTQLNDENELMILLEAANAIGGDKPEFVSVN